MNILMIYPRHPNKMWSFITMLKFLSEMEFPPVDLLAISSMLPRVWTKKFVDLNLKNLSDENILWADYVFICAEPDQEKSANRVIEKCKKLKAKIVVVGSFFVIDEHVPDVAHHVIDDLEITLPQFLSDLHIGSPKIKYSSEGYKDVRPAY